MMQWCIWANSDVFNGHTYTRLLVLCSANIVPACVAQPMVDTTTRTQPTNPKGSGGRVKEEGYDRSYSSLIADLESREYMLCITSIYPRDSVVSSKNIKNFQNILNT